MPDSTTLRSLEWGRLKEFLAAEASTDWGRQLCLEAPLHQERLLVESLLEETDEGLALIQSRSGLSLEGLPDLREVLSRLRAGGDLDTQELNQAKAVLIRTKLVRSSLSLLENKIFPRLSQFISSLHPMAPLVEDIDQTLDEAAQVKDQASPRLSSLRREIVQLERQIKEELNKIIHSSTLSKSLQEPLYTQRNGRWVLPVNASLRHSIPGIVHDSSASGLTVFVEPLPVVELANKARICEADAEHEIARILSQLSSAVREHVDEIDSSYRSLIEIDFILARARLATKYNGTKPIISDDGRLELRSARHPLLILQNPAHASLVVPNDIKLDTQRRTLVITGPNTGGKTVLLKTAGLLSLMIKAGLLLPAASGSSATIFQQIQADIGDEQSLAQNLSTFSSHMINLVEIIKTAGGQSLVLLDEIGAGTDPKQGAALARAILEHLNQSGAITIATTHFGELKTLAYTQPGFLNASLEFDETSLSPTYKLLPGIPGSSQAITIAARLGLDPQVVNAAESFMQRNEGDLQAVIERLESKLQETAKIEEQARQLQASARQLEQEAQARLETLQSQKENLRAAYAQQIEEEFATAREMMRELIARLQKEPGIAAAQQAQQQMQSLRQQLNWLSPEKAAGQERLRLSLGQTVRVRSLNQIGVVEDLPETQPDQDSLIAIRCGVIKVRVALSDLELLPAPSKQRHNRLTGQNRPIGKPPPATASKSKLSNRGKHPDLPLSSAPVFIRTSGNTLDLRGQRVEEALNNLERFVDAAMVQGISPIMIIHGHGTGAVKNAVRHFLQQSSYIQSFRPGENHEGGDGVTIVEL